MTNFTDGIPEREVTLQYKPLGDEEDVDTPRVADGTQIKLFAENVKEIFQKEPTFTPIQKGPDSHNEGDKTLVTDTLKAKHQFEITAWVYSGKDGKHSIDESIRTDSDGTVYDEIADTTFPGADGPDEISADEFEKWYPLGDTGIVHDSETVSIIDGAELERGTDYEMNYSRGEIKFLEDSEEISSEEEETSFGPIDLGTQTVITDDFEISYRFDATANNIARLIRRMSQLGNPIVMRMDKQDISDPTDDGASEELDSRDYLVVPKKIQIVSKSEKPDEYKIELELRKATTER